MSRSQISRTGQVVIPTTIRRELALHKGDDVEITVEGTRIVLTPVGARHPELDAALADGLADARAGRVSPKFKSAAEFTAWLKTPEGRMFWQT